MIKMEDKGYIFLLEDDEDLQSIISQALEIHDYIVDVHDGEKIRKSQKSTEEIKEKMVRPLDAVRKMRYDLAILDINVKGDSQGGLNLLKHLRRYDKEIPIIMTSKYSYQGNVVDSIEYGVHDFIVKQFPFDLERLVNEVDRTIEYKKIKDIENSL